MKRIISLILITLMLFSLAACSNNEVTESKIESTSSESEVLTENNEESENAEENVESVFTPSDMSTAIQIIDGEKNGELPEIEGPDKFVELFLKNPIDAYYIEEISMAPSVSAMLNVTNNSMKYWEAEINSVYSELMVLMGEDSEEFKKIKLEQNAWINDIAVSTQEIKAEIENSGVDGSMINIEISYRLMLLQRGRAVELLCSAYNLTGEVDVTITDEAAG